MPRPAFSPPTQTPHPQNLLRHVRQETAAPLNDRKLQIKTAQKCDIPIKKAFTRPKPQIQPTNPQVNPQKANPQANSHPPTSQARKKPHCHQPEIFRPSGFKFER